ncbi:Hypothetical predicted protein [Mytilus galloprovincialis]|uniref:EB domain-containing protein n=1 Tax=Mytilus galloprovincialis TaxID=29158 RepID=A0A8B6G4W2_MYTGA|nr:Hypothetical predicted protein [Mytilus galloprovincialis]
MVIFVIYVEVGVEGVAYDGACKVNGNCSEANNVCTSTKCACSTTSFKEDSTTKCASKIALDGTCTASPAGQCIDTNAACHATHLKCKCKSSFFANKAAACASEIAALNDACDATDPSPGQCAKDNSECRIDGSGGKCLCKTTHYTDGGNCVIRIVPGASCASTQCVNHASCNTTSKCQCDAGYTATPTAKPTMCNGVIKVATLWYMMAVPIYVSMMSLLR